MSAPCPADGAVLHAVDVSFDEEGGYYTTGKCENCGERLHEEGERYEPDPESWDGAFEIDLSLPRFLADPGRRAQHWRAP